MMNSLEKIDLTNTVWTYRGEGNANIVIALEEELRVIRLSKTPKDLDHERNGLNSAEHSKQHHKKLIREITNMNEIVKPLVGPELIGEARIVEIDQEHIGILNEQLLMHRPSHRLHKELRFTHGTCHTDFARLHPEKSQIDYCIEIKPKQANFNPSSELTQTSGLCQFCLHQFLKLKQAKIISRSNYCPLDLFSGQPTRMIFSLISLLQNPQNNLRIFKNGETIFDENKLDKLPLILDEWFMCEENCRDNLLEKSKSLKRFLYILCLAVMKPLNQKSSMSASVPIDNIQYLNFENDLRQQLLRTNLKIFKPDSHKLSCGFVEYRNLPSESALSTICNLQAKSNDQPSSIFDVYEKICPIHTINEQTQIKSIKSPDEERTRSTCPSIDCYETAVWIDELDLSKLITEDEVTRLENFLLSATAKDCSLMITISSMGVMEGEVKPNNNAGLGSSGENSSSSVFYLHDLYNKSYMYKIKIGLADLDIKPITCVPKQCVRDCDMLASYNEIKLQNQ